jgi:hypothetical protein
VSSPARRQLEGPIETREHLFVSPIQLLDELVERPGIDLAGLAAELEQFTLVVVPTVGIEVVGHDVPRPAFRVASSIAPDATGAPTACTRRPRGRHPPVAMVPGAFLPLSA